MFARHPSTERPSDFGGPNQALLPPADRQIDLHMTASTLKFTASLRLAATELVLVRRRSLSGWKTLILRGASPSSPVHGAAWDGLQQRACTSAALRSR